MKVNDHVKFNKGDGTTLTGRIFRVWANKKYVSIKTDGDSQTYVRYTDMVKHVPRKSRKTR